MESRRRRNRDVVGLRVRDRRRRRSARGCARLLALRHSRRDRSRTRAGRPPLAAPRRGAAAPPSHGARFPRRRPLGAPLRDAQARVGRSRDPDRVYGSDLPGGAGAAPAAGSPEQDRSHRTRHLGSGHRADRARRGGRRRHRPSRRRNGARRRDHLRPHRHLDEEPRPEHRPCRRRLLELRDRCGAPPSVRPRRRTVPPARRRLGLRDRARRAPYGGGGSPVHASAQGRDGPVRRATCLPRSALGVAPRVGDPRPGPRVASRRRGCRRARRGGRSSWCTRRRRKPRTRLRPFRIAPWKAGTAPSPTAISRSSSCE
jgi:hypothetical protein